MADPVARLRASNALQKRYFAIPPERREALRRQFHQQTGGDPDMTNAMPWIIRAYEDEHKEQTP
jgi:hypothetical protein